MKKILFFFALWLLGIGAIEAQEARLLKPVTTAQNPIKVFYTFDGVEQKDLDKWFGIAQGIHDSLMVRFADFQDSFEAVALLTPSKQSGVTYRDSTKVRDTHFGSYFENSNYLKLPDWGEDKLIGARIAVFPEYDDRKDITVILVNDPRFAGWTGGASWSSLVSYRNTSDILVAIHEVGLQLGLFDERYFSYFPSLDPFPNYPNLIKIKKENQGRITRDQIPWGKLIEASTPLPTPFEENYRGKVGLFPVSLISGLEYLVSQMDCIMGSSSNKFFCAACRLHIDQELERRLALKPLLVGDFDGDGVVGLDDFFIFAECFGFKRGSAGYKADCDLDKNGEIGFLDFFIFTDYFGKKQ